MPLPPGAGCCAHKYYSQETDGPTNKEKWLEETKKKEGEGAGAKRRKQVEKGNKIQSIPSNSRNNEKLMAME